MSTLGAELVDARLAARQPVTARLMRAFRNNTRILAPVQFYFPISMTVGDQTGSVAPTYATVGSFGLYVPDKALGVNGCTLTLYGAAVRGVPPPTIPKLQRYRLKIGSDTGTVATHAGPTTTSKDLTISWTPTGNTRVLVELQANVQNSGDVAELLWNGLGILEPVR